MRSATSPELRQSASAGYLCTGNATAARNAIPSSTKATVAARAARLGRGSAGAGASTARVVRLPGLQHLVHDEARAAARLVEISPQVFADDAHHEELSARDDQEHDHQRGPALHLEVEGEVRDDDEEGISEAGNGDEEPEERGGADGAIRECDERVDEVLQLSAQRPHRRPVAFRALLAVERHDGRVEAEPEDETHEIRVALLNLEQEVAHAPIDDEEVEALLRHGRDREAAEEAVEDVREKDVEGGVVAPVARGEDDLLPVAPVRKHRVERLGGVLQVGRDRRDGVAMRMREAREKRGVRAEVAREPHDPKARLVLLEAREDREGVVLRAVVHAHELERVAGVARRERRETREEVRQARRVVVHGDDDREDAHRPLIASLSAAATSRTCRAGTPATIVQSGTSCVTTAPGATIAPSPTVIPATRFAPVPTSAQRRMRGPFTDHGARPKRVR